MKLLPMAAVLLGLSSLAAGKKKPHVYIDHNCIQDLRGTEKTVCVQLPNKPELAKCNEVIVAFSCVTVKPRIYPTQKTAEKGKDVVNSHKEIPQGTPAQGSGSAGGGADPRK